MSLRRSRTTRLTGRCLTGLALAAILLAGCGVPPDPFAASPSTPASYVTPDSDPDSSSAPKQSDTTSAETSLTESNRETTGSDKSEADQPSKTTEKAILSVGSEGEKVRELQHRLRQLDWYSGQITDSYGEATTQAVRGFQKKRKLAVTGEVDQATWEAIVGLTRTPTRDETHNKLAAGPALWKRGSSGDKIRELQARLKQIGWFSEDVTPNYGPATESSVKGFQDKRVLPVTGEVDQRTWDRLVAMSREPTRDELRNVQPKASAAGLDSRCLTGRALCISKSSNTLTWVIDGQPQLSLDVRFGAYETPTRNGSFSVGWKARDWVSTIYKTPMPYSMFFSGGQAVHYSADFAARGYNGASHGCVNVRNRDGLRSLFDQVQVGDKVIVY